jgi:hypothetical protein
MLTGTFRVLDSQSNDGAEGEAGETEARSLVGPLQHSLASLQRAYDDLVEQSAAQVRALQRRKSTANRCCVFWWR